MSSSEQDKEKKFIREKIVPRKRYKKVLGVIAAVAGTAVLLGASAGGVYFMLQRLAEKEEAETPVETIVIARDDISISPDSSAEADSSAAESEPPEETEEPETGGEKETPEALTESAESEDAGSGSAENADGKETAEESTEDESASGDAGSTAEDAGTTGEEGSGSGEEETDNAPSGADENGSAESGMESVDGETSAEEAGEIQKLAGEIGRSVVRITVRKAGGKDWLSTDIMEKTELSGYIIAETTDQVLVLSNAEGMSGTGISITVSADGISCPARVQCLDTISGLAVLRVDKSDIAGHYEVLTLGNSLNVKPADPVWFYGFSRSAGNGLNEGSVTYVEDYRPEVDGYVQKITTNMLHLPGEQGILLNRRGDVIGLVDDSICTDGAVMSAKGISPMKYLLEDMCSGGGTAYIGIRCMDVLSEDAEALDIPAGLYIQEVIPDSPAYQAGLLPGDRIVRLGYGSVNTNHMLLLWMDIFEPDKELRVQVERRGKDGYEPLDLEVTPESRN